MTLDTYTPKNTQIVHSTSVDFSSRPIGEPVHIVQYDDRIPILAVSLYKDGQVYKVPTEASANIRWGKPDRKFVYNPAIGISADRSILYFEVTVQMVTVCGSAAPIVELEYSDGNAVGSSPITIIIDRNPIQHGDIESSDEYKTAKGYAEDAEKSAKAASTSEKNAKKSEDDASASAKAAKKSEENAKASENAAASSASAAKTSEGNAKKSEENAKASENAAASSATDAINAASAAKNAAASAGQSATNAESAAENAAASAEDSSNFAIISKSYAIGETGIRDGEDTDNSKYYYKESKKNSESAANSAKGIKDAEENAAKSAERAEEAAKKAQSIAEGYRGYFATPEDLEVDTPIGEDGYWAIVGSTNTMWIWDGDTSSWVNSSTSVSGDFLPLSGGTMTGNISVERNGYVATPVATYDGDENGMDMVINSGGINYVGGGNAADILKKILEDDLGGTDGLEKSLLLAAETFAALFLGDGIDNACEMMFIPNPEDGTIKISGVGDPEEETDAVNLRTFAWVINIFNEAFANVLPLIGGTMQGDLNMGQHFITNLMDPVDPQDAVNKRYVDQYMNSEMHRNIFRGEYLGSSINPIQRRAISDGTFNNLYIGDYWTINGINWRIVDIDYWYTTIKSTHHIVIMPDDYIGSSKMFESTPSDSSNGYFYSLVEEKMNSDVKSIVESAFGKSYIFTPPFRQLVKSVSKTAVVSTTSNNPFCIPNSNMIFGYDYRAVGREKVTSEIRQLSLFRLNPKFITYGPGKPNGYDYWLRDIYDVSTSFVYFYSVTSSGLTTRTSDQNIGMRPVFGITG